MSSNIPAFVSKFLSALAVDFDEPNEVALHDGTPMGDEHVDYFAVGYSETGSAIEAQEEPITLGNGRGEQFAVACQVVVVNGDADMNAARGKAFGIYDSVESVLAQDWTVDGTVTRAGLVVANVQQQQTTFGAVVVIDCAVAVDITPV